MKKLWRLFGIICILFVFIILFREPFSRATSYVNDRILSSFGKSFLSFGRSIRDLFSGDAEQLKVRVRELESERNALVVQNAQLHEAKNDYDTLSALLNFSKQAHFDLHLAHVIGGSSNPDVHTIEIDAGSNEGVLIGDAVITDGGIVVGKIVSVRDRVSTVELLTDARSRFAVSLASSNGTVVAGVSEGGHGTGMVMRLIPQSFKISNGEIVVTAGLESGVPRGLVLGRVESVSEEPNEPFQSAALSPLIDLGSVALVSVVKVPR